MYIARYTPKINLILQREQFSSPKCRMRFFFSPFAKNSTHRYAGSVEKYRGTETKT